MMRATVSGEPGRRKRVGEVGQNVGEELEGKGREEDGWRRRHLPRHPTVTTGGGYSSCEQ
jgi:hypothetical protein